MNKAPKPLTLVVIDPVKIEGEHFAIGEILKDVDYDLASQLTGAGRTRLANEEDLAKASAKSKKAAPAPAQ